MLPDVQFDSRGVARIIASAMVVAVSACGTPGDDLPQLPQATTARYSLGPGDQLRVVTFGEQALSGDFRVGDSGTIAIPLVGSVPAAGLTSDALTKSLVAEVEKAQLMKDPKIAVEVTQYRPVFILGEISKPGQYAYQPGMTALTAVAIAGGFTYRAVKSQFSIVRPASPGGDTTTIEGKANRETAVQPGDVITVFERYF